MHALHQYTTKSGATSLVAATAKTLIQLITPSTRRAEIVGFVVGLKSVTAAHTPVDIELLLQTTAGTALAGTLVVDDQASPAALCTAGITFTAEPAASTIIHLLPLTPVGGLIVCDLEGLGKIIRMAVSTRVGLRITAPDAQSNTHAELWHRE